MLRKKITNIFWWSNEDLKKQNVLLGIPTDLLNLIMQFVLSHNDLKSLLRLSEVDKALNKIVSDSFANRQKQIDSQVKMPIYAQIHAGINRYQLFYAKKAHQLCGKLKLKKQSLDDRVPAHAYAERREWQATIRTKKPCTPSGTYNLFNFCISLGLSAEPILQLIVEIAMMNKSNVSTWLNFYLTILKNIKNTTDKAFDDTVSGVFGFIIVVGVHILAGLGIAYAMKGLYELGTLIKHNIQFWQEDKELQTQYTALLQESLRVLDFYQWLEKNGTPDELKMFQSCELSEYLQAEKLQNNCLLTIPNENLLGGDAIELGGDDIESQTAFITSSNNESEDDEIQPVTSKPSDSGDDEADVLLQMEEEEMRFYRQRYR